MRLLIFFAIPVVCTATWTSALNDLATAELPRFSEPLNNLTISVGRDAVFNCIVENLGPYKVAWLRVDTQTILTIANHVITKNHRIGVTHSGHRMWSLQIKDTRETDKGWYMCQVNTDPMSKIVGFLNVVVPPDILDYPTSTDMVVREGSNVTLRCAATGTPKPMVTWRRERDSNTYVLNTTGSDLDITRVTRKDMGPYLCIASNGVPPTVSKRIVLTVHFQPMVSVENQLIGAFDGQTLILECHSEAFPRPITYWTRPTNETITNGIDRPETTRKPNTRSRDSKKTWSIDHSQDRKAAGMRDESMLKESETGEEQIDFQSATASSALHRHLFVNLGMAAVTAIFVGSLSS
ncbi:lachesin-like isoform X3 [Prorops nasuta]|uniref:lachesin-like isoform X3 n=1 Tax=Prorops nasuta TaxID=863751 RepID=UPI0034CDAE9D